MLEKKRLLLTELFEDDPCKRAVISTECARCYVMKESDNGNYDYISNSFIVERDSMSENMPPIIVLFNGKEYLGVYAYSQSCSCNYAARTWCNIDIPTRYMQPLLDKINELTKHS